MDKNTCQQLKTLYEKITDLKLQYDIVYSKLSETKDFESLKNIQAEVKIKLFMIRKKSILIDWIKSELNGQLTVSVEDYIKDTFVFDFSGANIMTKGDLSLSGRDVTYLPDNLDVHGNLNLSDSQIRSLPDAMYIKNELNLYNTPIKILPSGLRIRYDLDIRLTKIKDIPDDIYVGDDIYLDKKLKNRAIELKAKNRIKGDIIA